MNAARVVGKGLGSLKVVINGAGAAGIAIANILISSGVRKILLVDSKGIICTPRSDLNEYKRHVAEAVNMDFCGSLSDALSGADVFIGVSKEGLLKKEMIKAMADKPVIFAMANPTPEIMPDDAREAGAFIVATGRSDFPNQVNNVLAFPGVFRGSLDARAGEITEEMKIAAAKALAGLVKSPEPDKIIPSPFDKGVVEAVAEAVKKAVFSQDF
jgi:malate dehydrogenase (oxaloacetate-decarboxylating)